MEARQSGGARQLDEAIFDAAWVEGKTLSLEQAVDYAMKNVK